MPAMLKIGVTACFMYPDVNRAVHGPKQLCYLENDMAVYLNRHHAMPILIPDLPQSELLAFIDKMDGLILSGGVDVAPESYNEKPIEHGRWKGDRYRDLHELKLTEHAMNRGIPILGICRGVQILNVFLGGTLYQDIRTQNPECLIHRDAVSYDNVKHGISFEPGGVLENLYEDVETRFVNSVHHQSIKDLADELKLEAWCTEDGVVEAVNWKKDESGKVLGIQWHPEFFHTLTDQVIPADPVYDHFLACCEK